MAAIPSSFRCQQVEEAFLFQEKYPMMYIIKALLLRLRLFDCHHVSISSNRTITVDQRELDLKDKNPFILFGVGRPPQVTVQIEKRAPQGLPSLPLSPLHGLS